jgi:uncharacterized damage-inducible protein DinB
MPPPSVDFADLLAYNEDEWRRWRAWFAANPGALDVAIDVADSGTARGLVKHIVLVERRYAEWLAGEPLTAPTALDALEASALFALADDTFVRWHRIVDTMTEAQWREGLPFPKPMEHLKPTRRKCFVHVIVHSIRHWAQLATALRAAGFKQDWYHDLVMSEAIE